MNSHRFGIIQPKQETEMSSVPALAQVARGMIQREKNRLGCPQAARDTVARRIKIGAGSLSNLIRERIKTVSADLRDRLVSAAIADLTNELTKLEHERQLLLQMGTSPDHDDMRSLESALATARQAIERMK